MEELFVWLSISSIQWSQESKILVWSKGAEYETAQVDGVSEGLRL